MTKRRINVYGSACNPTHNVHQLILEDLCQIGFDEVWFMPCSAHVFGKDMIAPIHRLKMAEIAAIAAGAYVCDYQINLGRKIPTWDTLQAFHASQPDVEFSFTIGGDNLADFDKWHRWEELADKYHVVAYRRNETVSDSILSRFRNLTIRELELNPIYDGLSSTKIRALLANNDPEVDQYLHPAVSQYIRENSLYRGE